MSRRIANLKEGGHLAYGYDRPLMSYFLQHYDAEDELIREWASNPILIEIGEHRPHSNGDMLDAFESFKEYVVEDDLDRFLEGMDWIAMDLEIPQ